MDGGEGGADRGEFGGVLRGAGGRRKRPALVVAAAAAMRERRRARAPRVVAFSFSLHKSARTVG